MAQEPAELDRTKNPKVGVDGPGTVRNGHRLRDETGASRHLTSGRTPGRPESWSKTGAP